MKKILLFISLLLTTWIAFGEGPLYQHKDNTVNKEFDNVYQDIRNKLPIYSTMTFTSTASLTGILSRYATLAGTQTFTGGVTLSSASIVGVTDGSDACVGCVGELIEVFKSTAQALPQSSTYGDMTSITLTPGDWDVTASILYSSNGATWSGVEIGIGTASGNNSAGLTPGKTNMYFYFANSSTAFSHISMYIPPVRISVTSPTVYYLKEILTYTAGTPTARGRITARRVR